MNATVENKQMLKENALFYIICCNRKFKKFIIMAPLALCSKHIDTDGLIDTK